MNKTFTVLIAGLVLAISALSATAQDSLANSSQGPVGLPGKFYIGAVVGTESATVSAAGIDLGDNAFSGGVFAGWQNTSGNLVYGLEADITVSDVTPDIGALIKADSEYLASIVARLGFQVGNATVYGLAGLAITDFEINALGLKSSESATGYTIGAGVDLALTEHVFLRIEGRRYDFSGERFTSLAGANADATHDQLRLGAGWRF